MSRVIEAKALKKSYQDQEAVCGVELEITTGECFGLLGPNGAGKSSLLRMLYGSAAITSGELFVLGINAKEGRSELKRRIGVIPQEDGLDPDFSVLENLLIFASYFGIKRVVAKERAQSLLEFMKLQDYANQPVDHLSGGMRRRLSIARALINEPELIFLDEPTTGLDPQVRLWIWDRLRALKQKNITIFLSTHYMEEAQRLCDRVAIMNKGLILDVDSPRNLIAKHIGDTTIDLSLKPEDMDYYIQRIEGRGLGYLRTAQQLSVYTRGSVTAEDLKDFDGALSLSVRPATLDDVFLKITGQELEGQLGSF